MFSDEEERMTLAEVGKKINLNYRSMERLCRIGRRGLSGAYVKLNREKSERGWVTTMEEVQRFRQRLNDPRYGVVHPSGGTES